MRMLSWFRMIFTFYLERKNNCTIKSEVLFCLLLFAIGNIILQINNILNENLNSKISICSYQSASWYRLSPVVLYSNSSKPISKNTQSISYAKFSLTNFNAYMFYYMKLLEFPWNFGWKLMWSWKVWESLLIVPEFSCWKIFHMNVVGWLWSVNFWSPCVVIKRLYLE